ncbi:hypothetical protein [Streptomyces sp. NPDC054863]
MDFFLGEITRDHEDIGWFAWSDGAGALAEGLLLHGCRAVPGPPPDLKLDFSFEIKRMTPTWDPSRPRRTKGAAADHPQRHRVGGDLAGARWCRADGLDTSSPSGPEAVAQGFRVLRHRSLRRCTGRARRPGPETASARRAASALVAVALRQYAGSARPRTRAA